MVSSAIPIITFRYYPYKKKKLTFWVSLLTLALAGSISGLSHLRNLNYKYSYNTTKLS